ncbi:MAG: hypothetical protein WCB58_16280, partial [Acidobacteriaceae bacterium]
MADVPTAADENAADGLVPGDAMEAGLWVVLSRVSLVAGVPADARAVAWALCVSVLGASSQVSDVRRAVVGGARAVV